MKFILVSLLSSSLFAAIHVTDHRREFYEVPDSLKKLSSGVAAVFKTDSLEHLKTGWKLSAKTETYEKWAELCPDETYANQMNPAVCTAFLVAPDRIATAGHCVANQEVCDSLSFVFDFQISNEKEFPHSFGKDQVYGCKKLLASSNDPDYAVIQLDRAVRNRKPFGLSDKAPALRTPVILMGFPHGIPLKVVESGKVQDNQNSNSETYFEIDSDLFSGNSGSPVLNAETFEVEGIVAVGFGEFEQPIIHPKTKKPCRYVRRWKKESDATYSWVSRITNLKIEGE